MFGVGMGLRGSAMRWERWLAASIGFTGVLIVRCAQAVRHGRRLFRCLMLASSPVFAASFLMTKSADALRDAPAVIVVWQAITVTLVQPAARAAGTGRRRRRCSGCGFLLCGLLGSTGHYCLTRSFRSRRHLGDAVGEVPRPGLGVGCSAGWCSPTCRARSTLIGGAVICAATIWIARRESRRGLVTAQELAKSAESPAA